MRIRGLMMMIIVIIIGGGCQPSLPQLLDDIPPTPIAMPVIPALAPSSITYTPINACMPATEKTAFDLRLLQTRIMIAAIKCGYDTEYNRFMLQHQSELWDAHNQITAHFERLFGTDGEQQRDAYITELANAEGQEASSDVNFCRDEQAVVERAESVEDISQFVAGENMTNNPYSLPICTNLSVPERQVSR